MFGWCTTHVAPKARSAECILAHLLVPYDLVGIDLVASQIHLGSVLESSIALEAVMEPR